MAKKLTINDMLLQATGESYNNLFKKKEKTSNTKYKKVNPVALAESYAYIMADIERRKFQYKAQAHFVTVQRALGESDNTIMAKLKKGASKVVKVVKDLFKALWTFLKETFKKLFDKKVKMDRVLKKFKEYFNSEAFSTVKAKSDFSSKLLEVLNNSKKKDMYVKYSVGTKVYEEIVVAETKAMSFEGDVKKILAAGKTIDDKIEAMNKNITNIKDIKAEGDKLKNSVKNLVSIDWHEKVTDDFKTGLDTTKDVRDEIASVNKSDAFKNATETELSDLRTVVPKITKYFRAFEKLHTTMINIAISSLGGLLKDFKAVAAKSSDSK